MTSVGGFSNTALERGGETRVKSRLPILVLCLIGLYLIAFIIAVVFVFG